MDDTKVNHCNEFYSDADKLDFEGFRDCVIGILSDICGPEFRVEERQVIKNNAVKLYGVSISENNSAVAPTIYLEVFYEEYLKGVRGVQEIANEVLRVYSNNRTPGNFELEKFLDYEKVRMNLGVRLINREKNREFLGCVPHRDFLNLAVIYTVRVGDKNGFASITVRNEHLEKWGISEDELRKDAENNMESIMEPRIRYLYEFMESLGCSIGEETGMSEKVLPMYVLTNRSGNFGAAAVIMTGLLREFAENKESDLYILPSSVHELILLPISGDVNVSELRSMVKSVNESVLDKEDFLSDDVYYYSREDDEITIAG
ncbi:hypothetical protein SAMN06296386_103316 [Lachnospiraceae bacterium]|nr:hypothetical protein SAMN06296386_103316 [Lachnospiraceae bacterium]